MGKKQRRIGQVFERFVAAILQPVFPNSKVARGLQYRDATMCDVEGTPFRIECKRRANKSDLSHPAHLKFLEKNAAEGRQYEDSRIPITVSKLKGRYPAIVTMYLTDFAAMVEEHFYSKDGKVDIDVN